MAYRQNAYAPSYDPLTLFSNHFDSQRPSSGKVKELPFRCLKEDHVAMVSSIPWGYAGKVPF